MCSTVFSKSWIYVSKGVVHVSYFHCVKQRKFTYFYFTYFTDVRILWKDTVSSYFRVTCPKLCGNCAFSQNSHAKKLGEIKVFNIVFTYSTKTLEMFPSPQHHLCPECIFFTFALIFELLDVVQRVKWVRCFNVRRNFQKQAMRFRLCGKIYLIKF